MLASHQNHELVGIEDKYIAWRWGVFKALKELKEKQNLIINIRYTPYKEIEYREKEEPTLKEWGFTVSESVPSNLMEDLLTSVAIMSSTSSVMSTARLFGKLVYRVENYLYPYVHVDDNIHEVKISEIPDIVIPEGDSPSPEEVDEMVEKAIEEGDTEGAIVRLTVRNIARSTYQTLPRRSFATVDPSALLIRVDWEYAAPAPMVTVIIDEETGEEIVIEEQTDAGGSGEDGIVGDLLPLEKEAEGAVATLVANGTIPSAKRDDVLSLVLDGLAS
jgi:hypothetical protein